MFVSWKYNFYEVLKTLYNKEVFDVDWRVDRLWSVICENRMSLKYGENTGK